MQKECQDHEEKEHLWMLGGFMSVGGEILWVPIARGEMVGL